MKSVIAVHNTFSRNWIFRSGFATSGRMPQNGLITSRNLTVVEGGGDGGKGSRGLGNRVETVKHSRADGILTGHG